MNNLAYQSTVLCVSLFFALLMAIYPLSITLSWARPDWVVLVVIYWVLQRPQQLGVGSAWMIGLLQDVFVGGVWGAHALALSLVTYMCSKSYRRLRSYSLLQQTFWIFIFVGMHHVFVSWVQGFSGFGIPAHLMLASVLTSAVCWPILVLSLRKLKITASSY